MRLTNSDQVSIGAAGSLELTKEVCNASNGVCNLATGEGFARSNRGLPGDRLVYRIMFEVLGPEPVAGVFVADKTPAFSALTATVPSIFAAPDSLSCEVTSPAAPAIGYQGPLGWTCTCLLYTSPSPRDQRGSRMPSSA